jgi:hypothetical protein
LIATMRAKTEWVMEPDERGRVTPRKVGLAPQQRSDIEFEFTMMMEIEASSHRASVSKSRFADFADKVFAPNECHSSAEQFLGWLKSGKQMVSRNIGDGIKQQISLLNDLQRDYLREQWKLLGLPKAEHLDEDSVETAQLILREALQIVPFEEPAEELAEAPF